MRGPARGKVLELVRRAEGEERLCVAATRTQSRQLARAVACGLLIRPYPATYATPDCWEGLSPEQRALYAARALAVCHPAWCFAGPTAGVAHGLWVGWEYLSSIYVATDAAAHSAGHGPLRRIEVSDDQPVERLSLRVTSFMRTLYDCLRVMPFPDALAVADSALRAKGISKNRLAENMVRAIGRRRDCRRVLGVIGHADGRSENGGESVARAHMLQLGFAAPELQVAFDDSLDQGAAYRVDYRWKLPDGTVVVGELDGKDKYRDPTMTKGKDVEQVLLDERRREAHLTLAEYPVRVMRFSLAEATDDLYFERLLLSYGVPRAYELRTVV